MAKQDCYRKYFQKKGKISGETFVSGASALSICPDPFSEPVFSIRELLIFLLSAKMAIFRLLVELLNLRKIPYWFNLI